MNVTLEKTVRKRQRKIPDALVYEIMDGQPIYYKGYKSVLNKSKKIDDIFGMQFFTIRNNFLFSQVIFIHLDEKSYRIYTNEIGLHLDNRNNLSGYICIFNKTEMTADKVDNHYVNIPVELQFEIDIKGEVADTKQQKYMADKTNKLLQFGTKKVIWILTDSRQVMIAERDKDWLIFNWDKAFEIINGINANIGKHLLSNGIVVI